jgi:hypothetical protein
MRRIVAAILLTAWAGLAQEVARSAPQSEAQSPPPDASTTQKSILTVPSGTKVSLALTRPIWAKTVQVGDTVYSATAFPVAVGNAMAIPPGTYVEGKIDALKRPGWLSGHAEFQLHFTKLIFANGYTVELSDVVADSPGAANQAGSGNPATAAAQQVPGTSAAPNAPVDIAAAVARIYVDVSSRSDVLLDNGAPIEMLLQTPLSLESGSVAAAVRRSQPLQITPSKSSTRCVPTPGTPGSPDTVIPGTPGTPGTPDTVIPGGPGTPPTVIPGTPATAGTPPTIIPGAPGTAGTVCPAPPMVISQTAEQDVHTKTVTLTNPMQVGGTQLSAGKYQIRWTGLGPAARVEILQNKKEVVAAAARVVILGKKSAADAAVPRTNADGSVSLESLQFAAEAFALFFD